MVIQLPYDTVLTRNFNRKPPH